MLKGKILLEYINLFSPNEYKKNDKIILKYFQFFQFYVCNKYRKLRKTKISYIVFKKMSLSIVYSKSGHEYEKTLKEEESIEILKIWKSIKKYIIMSEENISQEFRLKNIDETRNYIIEEINEMN